LIKTDGYPMTPPIDMYEAGEPDHSYAFGRAAQGFTIALAENNPDIVLVLGDRLEILAAVIPAVIQGRLVAHIHGGDTSACGMIDDSIRHAITKFAHIHFAATNESATRLRRLGEEDFRIHTVGSPAIDAVRQVELLSRTELASQLNFHAIGNNPLIVCLFHSVAYEADRAYDQMSAVLRSIAGFMADCVVIYPNNDTGNEEVIRAINEHAQSERFHVVKNLSSREYYSLLDAASCLIGNSSSGLIETPIFGLPSLSVGSRQTGREHGNNVIFVGHDQLSVESGLRRVLYDVEFRQSCREARNPYGDGRAADRISEVLATVELTPEFLIKKLTY